MAYRNTPPPITYSIIYVHQTNADCGDTVPVLNRHQCNATEIKATKKKSPAICQKHISKWHIHSKCLHAHIRTHAYTPAHICTHMHTHHTVHVIYRSSIGNPSGIYRNRSNHYRISIEHIPEIRPSTGNPSIIYRTSNEHLLNIYRPCIEHLSCIDRPGAGIKPAPVQSNGDTVSPQWLSPSGPATSLSVLRLYSKRNRLSITRSLSMSRRESRSDINLLS